MHPCKDTIEVARSTQGADYTLLVTARGMIAEAFDMAFWSD